MNPKEYYAAYIADRTISRLSSQLLIEIMEYNPSSAFEFGHGSGKHLSELHKMDVVTFGIDISRDNVCTSMFAYNLPFVGVGTEAHLRHLVNMDVVFTCSVLDHIESVSGIIGEFKRICNKAVVLAEPQHHEPELFYWSHDYELFGFKKTNFSWIGEDGVTYFIWIWIKGSDVEDSHLNIKEG